MCRARNTVMRLVNMWPFRTTCHQRPGGVSASGTGHAKAVCGPVWAAVPVFCGSRSGGWHRLCILSRSNHAETTQGHPHDCHHRLNRETPEKPMSNTSPTSLTPADVAHLLRIHWKRWIVPAVCVAGLVAVYAVLRPAVWEATQTLIIRNEAANNQLGPGKFGHSDERKAVLETLLELARSRQVLAAGLEKVGPPADDRSVSVQWPSARDIEDLREDVEVSAPNGAEFGRTEVFYLKVKSTDRQRSIALNQAICDGLITRFQEIRDARAASMIVELKETVDVARADLDEATDGVAAIERQTGGDLNELRSLLEGGSNDSSLSRTTAEIRAELRQLQATAETAREMLALLEESQDDTGHLVATPNELLESQPALRALKEGLVAAQLRTAELTGRLNAEHPLAQAAEEAEANVARHLHEELAVAIRGFKAELNLAAQREWTLTERLDDANRRLGELAGLRASYANRLAEMAHRNELLKTAERNLSEARATHASARATSLIDRIDGADTGTNPVGPGRKIILLAGILGGLIIGLGVVFLTVQPVSSAPAVQPLEVSPQVRPSTHLNGRLPHGKLTFKEALDRLASSRA